MGFGGVFSGTVWADLSYESLCLDGVYRCCDEEGFYSHIDDPVDGGGSRVGMEGREYEMPCHSGSEGDFDSFSISYFSYHDYVGILTEGGSQSGGEIKSYVMSYLTLVESFHLVFDWVFDGHDVYSGFIEGGEG